jgi:hypothetical protein
MAVVVRQDRYVFSPRCKTAALVYLVVSVPLAAAVAVGSGGERGYLTAWTFAAALHAVPAFAGAPRALRGVPRRDRFSWLLWMISWGITYASNLVIYLVGVHGWEALRPLPAIMAAVGVVLVGIGNTAVLHRRSGQRALLLELVDPLMATVAVMGPLALLVARPLLSSPNTWLTVTMALVAVGMVHAGITQTALWARLSPDKRDVVVMTLCFTVVALLDTVSLAAQAVTRFALPGPPLVGIHAACMGGGVILAAFTLKESSPGLDRFPPQRQVRKTGPLALVLVASVTVLAVVAVVHRDDAWIGISAVGLLMVLVVLSALRQMALGRETVRLYGEVERAAEERRELLAEVMRYVDTDRSRAAAELHRQAASLYTAVASFTEANMAVSSVRMDLARQVEVAQQILLAMQAEAPAHEGLKRLVALTRAYLGNLYGDIRGPALDISIDDRLTVDWTHEVVVFRIVQMAVHNIWRHAGASRIDLSMTAPDGALTVEVRDDGVGFEPNSIVPGTGILTMQALAGFVDGRIEIESSPGDGTRVCAVVGDTPRVLLPARRHLRLITSTD